MSDLSLNGQALSGFADTLRKLIGDFSQSVCVSLPGSDALSDDLAMLRSIDKSCGEGMNNYLTALAMKEILKSPNEKILIIGYGKLTEQLERVLCDADIHILQFNHHKAEAVRAKYGDKAYFETAPLHKFPVIINTIPRQVIKLKRQLKAVVYELASVPYGFANPELLQDYRIEPGLPGRYYPKEAAKAVLDCIKRFIAKPTIVLCVTASSCCFDRLIPVVEELCHKYNVVPVMSENAVKQNRFVNIEEFKTRLRELCGNSIVSTIAGSETLSSRKDIVASAVVPATGNTIAKLANAITDTPVTMAVKALLRNSKPCVIGISTNDALSGNAVNIGSLLNRKNYYFVPFGQDAPEAKPFSCVCDFGKVGNTIEKALDGKQIQPIISC